ncbi:MAG: tRNA 2-thiouridine(34) synthase MnmA [candidate division WOR-3 bacterium]
MKVLVGLSGGVDSSVTAFLLKEMGYDVIGVTLYMWEESKNLRSCCSLEAINFARRIAFKLKIPHYTYDIREEFKEKIVKYFIESYLSGKTPNPCVLCNKFFKFGFLFEKAKELGCSYLATGHYAKIENGLIKVSKDIKRDQSYFLAFINKENIDKIILPLGDFEKEEVRRIAKENGFVSAYRPDSQDLCFVDGDYRKFLKKFVSVKKGYIINEEGEILGEHDGFFNFTIGQRKKLKISKGKRLYVKEFIPEENIVIVAEKEKVYKREIEVCGINWFIKPEEEFVSYVKIRQLHIPSKAKVYVKNDYAKVIFEKEQFAPTPGQVAAFYKDGFLLGGGWIK